MNRIFGFIFHPNFNSKCQEKSFINNSSGIFISRAGSAYGKVVLLINYNLCFDLIFLSCWLEPLLQNIQTKASSKREVWFSRSNSFSQIYILFRTEVLGDGNAVEVFADLAVVDGSDIEQKNETNKDEDTGQETYPK